MNDERNAPQYVEKRRYPRISAGTTEGCVLFDQQRRRIGQGYGRTLNLSQGSPTSPFGAVSNGLTVSVDNTVRFLHTYCYRKTTIQTLSLVITRRLTREQKP
jgi:hypothetical protein